MLVTRAQSHAQKTAAYARALGDDVLISPLQEIASCTWQPPQNPIAGLIFTSANAVYGAGPALAQWMHLPVFVVGQATADAARATGFGDVRHPAQVTDAQSLFDALAAQTFTAPLLHLAGRDHMGLHSAPSLQVERRIVYAAELVPQFTEEAARALQRGQVDAVLLYSPRTARHFARLYDALGCPRAQLIVGALSPAVAEAAGGGWAEVAVAAVPATESLFAAVHLATARRSG